MGEINKSTFSSRLIYHSTQVNEEEIQQKPFKNSSFMILKTVGRTRRVAVMRSWVYILTQRIHGTGIFAYIWLIHMVNVGKYSIWVFP